MEDRKRMTPSINVEAAVSWVLRQATHALLRVNGHTSWLIFFNTAFYSKSKVGAVSVITGACKSLVTLAISHPHSGHSS